MAHPEFVPLSEEEARASPIEEVSAEMEAVPSSSSSGGGQAPDASPRNHETSV